MNLSSLEGSKKIKDLTRSEAKELQELLVASGYPLSIDGIIGQRTIDAFKKFKNGVGLAYPDYIGPTTLQYLTRNKQQYRPSRRQINQAGLNLIKEFEGFRDTAYLCPSRVWTLGYGSTFYPDGTAVRQGDRITKDEGEKLLRTTVRGFEDAVSKLVTVPLNDNQFSALVSFAFNVGVGAFRSSTLLRKLNKKDYAGASLEFSKWVKGGGRTLPGLVRRRNAEKALFLK